MVRLQVFSDFHLEQRETRNLRYEDWITPPSPGSASSDIVLALLGDIGVPGEQSLKDFLAWCSQHWHTVLYVPGNHEVSSLLVPPLR
jgi:hypothetical protein